MWKQPTTTGIAVPTDQLTYIVSGAHLEWSVPDERARTAAAGEYTARDVVPTRMAMRHDDGTIYVAMPRLRRGVPFTLGAIDYDPCRSTIEPPISPYPCVTAHRLGRGFDNWTMVNVVDVFVDDGGTLWALDVGRTDVLSAGAAVIVRPPMVFAFDTEADKVS